MPETDRKDTDRAQEDDEGLQDPSVTKPVDDSESHRDKESKSKSDEVSADGAIKTIEINGKSFTAATGTQEEKDLNYLSKLATREAGHA